MFYKPFKQLGTIFRYFNLLAGTRKVIGSWEMGNDDYSLES
jgi:hypothetical protein